MQKKLIIIIIDILLLIGAAIWYFSMPSNKKDTNTNTIDSDEIYYEESNITKAFSTYKQSYKGFDLEIPTNVKFKEIDNYFFLLEHPNWKSEVQIYHDRHNLIIDNPNIFGNVLKEMKYNVSDPQKMTMDGVDFNVYKRYGTTRSVICTANFIGNFVYELDFYPQSNNFNISDIITTIEVMKKATYRYDDHTIFYYRNGDNVINTN